MLRVGQSEIDAIARVIESGQLFRYAKGAGTCRRFEERFAEFAGVKHVALCTSGTAALTAALAGLEIGPGDEVLVPAHTYMATAIAVLAVGAIPVVVDIDEAIAMCPDAARDAVGPRTRAMIPVHMWGQLCDMDSLLALAKEKGLLLIEDACQCVCGNYHGRIAGSMGDAGVLSFNYFKNMTCGEGGAVLCNDDHVNDRVRCMIDPCGFYWQGRDATFHSFAANGSRASELHGAMLSAQLDRVPELIGMLRARKKRVLEVTANTSLRATPQHDPDGQCGTWVMYTFETPAAADAFAEALGGVVLLRTGRHTYTEWDPILAQRGAPHPALNPYTMPQNAECRKELSPDQLPRSLDILGRTVMLALTCEQSEADVDALIERIVAAAP